MAGDVTTDEFNPERWVWGTSAKTNRFLHVMVSVRDIQASIRFYVDILGMKQLDAVFDFPERRVTGVVLGYDGYEAGGCIELIQYWDEERFKEGGSQGWHFALGVTDIEDMVSRLDSAGIEFVVRPSVLISGGPKLSFFKDPDGYVVELIQTRRESSPGS